MALGGGIVLVSVNYRLSKCDNTIPGSGLSSIDGCPKTERRGLGGRHINLVSFKGAKILTAPPPRSSSFSKPLHGPVV